MEKVMTSTRLMEFVQGLAGTNRKASFMDTSLAQEYLRLLTSSEKVYVKPRRYGKSLMKPYLLCLRLWPTLLSFTGNTVSLLDLMVHVSTQSLSTCCWCTYCKTLKRCS